MPGNLNFRTHTMQAVRFAALSEVPARWISDRILLDYEPGERLPSRTMRFARDLIDSRVIADEDAQEPAEWRDALLIPNGNFMLSNPDHGSFDYEVYSVTNGVLQGKRIVKIRFPGSRSFKGFGFVTRGGEFKLWRRFERSSNEPWVENAPTLLRALDTMRPSTLQRLHCAPGTIWNFWDATGRRHGIAATLRCGRCNAVLPQEARNLQLMLCDAHAPGVHVVEPERFDAYGNPVSCPGGNINQWQNSAVELIGADRPTATPPAPTTLRLSTELHQVRRSGARTAQAFNPPRRDRQPPTRTNPLPMCELGTGQVQ